MNKLKNAAFLMMALAATPALHARTKLVTLPDRDRLVANLEHPHYSLMYEEREITLQQGTNHIDFSWQGVSIDKNSIRLSVMDHPGEGPEATKIINVAFPPNEAALTWTLFSPEARTERIRVSYLLHGISRETSYEMTVNTEETKALFRQYFRMTNGSGEDLADSLIRIRQAEDWSRTVAAGESRRFLSYQLNDLPINKVFETRPDPWSQRGDDGEIISLIYEVKNDKANSLGAFKLDAGKSRIYSEVPNASTIFLGEDILEETAVGEKAELTLGTVKDVLLKRRIISNKSENERRNIHNTTVLYDRVVHVRYEIENFKNEPATVRVIETLSPDADIVEITSEGITTERKSGSEYHITIDLPARPAEGTEVPVTEVNFVYKIRDIMP